MNNLESLVVMKSAIRGLKQVLRSETKPFRQQMLLRLLAATSREITAIETEPSHAEWIPAPDNFDLCQQQLRWLGLYANSRDASPAAAKLAFWCETVLRRKSKAGLTP
ncbi:MAG TPA: hypothetical protein PKW21_00160 [Rhabdaerophilum sp.]|nr:hypothetical protein [Rhabdaerophilum sp.]